MSTKQKALYCVGDSLLWPICGVYVVVDVVEVERRYKSPADKIDCQMYRVKISQESLNDDKTRKYLISKGVNLTGIIDDVFLDEEAVPYK